MNYYVIPDKSADVWRRIHANSVDLRSQLPWHGPTSVTTNGGEANKNVCSLDSEGDDSLLSPMPNACQRWWWW